MRLTRPTPSLRVAENAYNTFTMGSSQLFNLSSLVRRWSNCWTRSWRTARTALGESQGCSRAARGWSRRLFLVLLSYACNEALKIDWKLGEEEDAMGERSGGETKLFGGMRTD